jgi:hypothetical protein
MGMEHKLRRRSHPHSGYGVGGHLDHPRLHKYAAAIWFLGQRRRVYDGLIALSAHKRATPCSMSVAARAT